VSAAPSPAGRSRLLSKVFGVAAFTLLSRLLGLTRDALLAWRFGAGAAFDAWNIAFLIPNLLRRILAEGALSVSMVPVFGQVKSERGTSGVHLLFRQTLGVYLMLVAAFMVVLAFAAPWLVRVFAPGFDGAEHALTTLLTRVNIVFIFFVALSTVAVAALNTLDHFNVPAATAAAQNICVIAGILVLTQFVSPGILGVALGAGLAGIATFTMVMWQLHRMGVPVRPIIAIAPEHKRMLVLMVPGLAGVMVYYINAMVGRALASLLPSGSVTVLYLSDRLVELPLGVVAVSVATVSLPRLSALAANNDMAGLRDALIKAVRFTLAVCLPAAAGLLALRASIIHVLFTRGAFGASAALLLGEVFRNAVPALLAMAAIRVVVQAFYGLEKPRVVVEVAAVTLALNALLGMFFMSHMGLSGLTLANSCALICQLGLLVYLLRRQLRVDDAPPAAPILGPISKMAVAALLMALVVGGLEALVLPWIQPLGMMMMGVFLAVAIGLGALVYGGLTLALGVDEVVSLISRVRRRLGR